MSAATLPMSGEPGGSANTRDPFMPRSAQRTGPALALALIAHVLLVIALALSVNWHTADDSPVMAELWSAVPQAAAPPAIEPPPPAPVETSRPQPPVERTPPPTPTPTPATPPTPAPALPDPQIAIEKARQEVIKREETRREQAAADDKRRKQAALDSAQRANDALAAKQAVLEKQRIDKEKQAKTEADKAAKDQGRLDKLKAEKVDKAEAARLEVLRKAQLNRFMAQNGTTGATGAPTDTGSGLRSAGPSAGYAGRIRAQIKRNIHFFDSVSGNPLASIEVRVAPDGTIIGRRLVKSSGVPTFDAAVLKAIDLTAVLPRDVDGRVPPLFQIDFKPNE